ncbi:MAG: ABC transporter permease [Bdellovibrionota bacterium]
MNNKLGVIFLLPLIVCSALIGFFFEDGFGRANVEYILSPPSTLFWLGTDSLGRDLLIRILFGAQTTFIVALFGALGIISVGLLIGTATIFMPRTVETIFLRVLDVVDGMPNIITVSAVALLIAQLTPASVGDYRVLGIIIITLTLTQWPNVARIVRSKLKVLYKEEYILASKSIGASTVWIIRKHLWPAIGNLLWVLFLIQLPQTIFLETFLSFVGLGIESPATSWGVLIYEGWKTLSYAPHLILAPAGFLFVTILCINQMREMKA